MSKPIVTTECVATQYEDRQIEYTYEELLEIFDDGSNSVRPLVLRCQEHERTIGELRAKLISPLAAADEWYKRTLLAVGKQRDAAIAKHAKLLDAVRELRAGIRNGTCYATHDTTYTRMVLNEINAILEEHR